MTEYSIDHLLNHKVQILQPLNGYRASTDAVFLASVLKFVKKDDTILDVGSGTGAVSLCLAHHFPYNKITGLEIQSDLTELSNQSAKLNQFSNLSYINVDIRLKKSPIAPCSFSHVVTNPPYYQNDFPSPNQSKAFAHVLQGFDLESWIRFCIKMLRPFGRFYMINRVESLDETLKTLSSLKTGGIEILPLYSKLGQPAKRIIISAQKDSKSPTSILPPFYIHNQDSSHTIEADKVLNGESLIFDH